MFVARVCGGRTRRLTVHAAAMSMPPITNAIHATVSVPPRFDGTAAFGTVKACSDAARGARWRKGRCPEAVTPDVGQGRPHGRERAEMVSAKPVGHDHQQRPVIHKLERHPQELSVVLRLAPKRCHGAQVSSGRDNGNAYLVAVSLAASRSAFSCACCPGEIPASGGGYNDCSARTSLAGSPSACASPGNRLNTRAKLTADAAAPSRRPLQK